jgi:diguanylate cyclase (GGDEF)-like protein
MFLDLDSFKRVNDSMGHAEGDRLLSEVARRLLKATRGSDVVARLGGDEFAVLLEKVHTNEQAEIIGERIIAGMRQPFALEGGEVAPTTSIGIARGREGQGATELLRNADVAMYVAKRHRAGRYMFFEPEMHAEVRDRISLEGDLRRALDDDQLTLAYQPIFHLASGRIRGVEALVRWEHPTRGALSPASFIDVAEESGLIVPLGRVVLAKACRDMAGWSHHLDDDTRFTLAVNISGKQLHATLTNDVAEVLRNTGVAPSSLLLEITEGVVMRDTEATLQRLHALKSLGVRLAIDDFGTGYSSLAYLQRFPIDVLKIDKSFVNHLGLGSGAQGASIAKTIVALGGALSLATVAEGVEREDQVEALRALGCDFVQGYHFSRPVGVAQITAMLAADQNAHAGHPQGQAA